MLMHVGFSFGFFSQIARPTAISKTCDRTAALSGQYLKLEMVNDGVA